MVTDLVFFLNSAHCPSHQPIRCHHLFMMIYEREMTLANNVGLAWMLGLSSVWPTPTTTIITTFGTSWRNLIPSLHIYYLCLFNCWVPTTPLHHNTSSFWCKNISLIKMCIILTTSTMLLGTLIFHQYYAYNLHISRPNMNKLNGNSIRFLVY